MLFLGFEGGNLPVAGEEFLEVGQLGEIAVELGDIERRPVLGDGQLAGPDHPGGGLAIIRDRRRLGVGFGRGQQRAEFVLPGGLGGIGRLDHIGVFGQGVA